jgi:NitT/TauT family transport system substrate-binding protein
MKRRTFLQLVAAPAIVSLAAPARAQAKQKITYLYQLDPVYETALWAIRNGKVTSSTIEIEATGANIPTLIQATATKQFDVVMTAVLSLSTAASQGLDLRIVSTALYKVLNGEGAGIWVKKGGPVANGGDLKGKTLGSFGLRSTGYMLMREALAIKYGLNVALEGGDFKQVEVVAANLPAALATGHVDAATLINSQAYRAEKAGDFANIFEVSDVLDSIYGRLVHAVNVSYPERLAARPEAFMEFERMMKESVAYALANRAEVFGIVGKQVNIDPAFFDWWYDRTTEIPGTFTDAHAKSVETVLEIGKRRGMIAEIPEVAPLIWEHVLRA